MKVYMLGFTKKTASLFFKLLEDNDIDLVVDIRLNNTSQLSGFAKYPDIEFFIKNIVNIDYKHDLFFSPTTEILDRYKKKIINWDQYETEFNELMVKRNIKQYILENYETEINICLLCSESTSENCHRKLVANHFKNTFNNVTLINL